MPEYFPAIFYCTGSLNVLGLPFMGVVSSYPRLPGRQRTMEDEEAARAHAHVKQYYGRDIETVEDFKTSSGCNKQDCNQLSASIKAAIKQIHPQVISK